MFALLILLSALLSEPSEGDASDCGLNPQSLELASLVINHTSQKRTAMRCNELLAEIAAKRAASLLNGQIDEQHTPNQILIENGYRFASFYPPTGNQVEAVAKNMRSAEAVMTYLTQSNKHHDHVLGYGEFFSRQNELGVGYAENEAGQTQYVVLIAEPYATPKIVYKQTFQAPKMVTKANCPKNWRHSSDAQVRKVCKGIEAREKQQKK
ncbi:hypothetical protein ACFODZ_12020 [Marinicella sediminis]|uniref:CAP domain-containing protein n=1 Tax=Marinicella sediminis TaxID=1792834 RepID=A0ABV7JDW4_9GAMM|nr:hypothetical protein [Marinicella sediminis]